MSASSVPPLPTTSRSPSGSRDGAGVRSRSTTSIRLRYRRQTATLMLATTVVGLWMALAAPSVSPVTPLSSPAVFGATDPAVGSTTDLPARARRNDQLGGDGPRGRRASGGDHR